MLGEMSASNRRESSSRRTSKTAYDSQRFERREKAKSSQGYAQQYQQYQNLHGDGARRGSLKPPGSPANDAWGSGGGDARAGASERPRLKARTNSAPLVNDRGPVTGEHSQQLRRDESTHREPRRPPNPTPAIAAGFDGTGQDEDETLGVVGAIRQFHPFQTNTPEVRPAPPSHAAKCVSTG